MGGTPSLNQEDVVSGLCQATCDHGSRASGPHNDKVILGATRRRGLKVLGHVAVVLVGGNDELREFAHRYGQRENGEFGLQHVCMQNEDGCQHSLLIGISHSTNEVSRIY